ncbi:MAG: SDR family NAD(P)-dependent oxidoreductase [Pseudomonadota bacterium]
MMDLSGKVAIVTGSGRARGLGEGILETLSQCGCDVVVSDIGEAKPGLSSDNIGATEEMESIAQQLRDQGTNAIAVPCDVRQESEVQNLIAKTVEHFGQLDILVNNAGVGYVMTPMDELSLEQWQLVIDVNLTGAFLCSKYAARQMTSQGKGGRIVNIASQAAKSGFPHMASYIASKHGLVGLTRSNAVELGKSGITINAVCPNHVTTGLGEKQNEYFSKFKGMTVDEYLADMANRIPVGRPGLPSDTAAIVAFLCSDEAVFITGEAWNVSGGEEMH